MQFVVGGTASAPQDLPLTAVDVGTPLPGTDPLICPNYDSNGFPTNIPNVFVRKLTLNEVYDNYGRLTQMLGQNVKVNGKFAQPLANAPTEVVANNSTEIWEIGNLTGDTHPIHFHLCQRPDT